MNFPTIGVVLGTITILLGGTGYAQCCNCGWDGGYNSSAKPENIRKFQKDSASLRDELAVKQQELAQEMNKPDYDPARVATIKKEIIDIETKLEVLARKNNVYPDQHYDRAGYRGQGMMRGGCGWGGW